MSVGFYYFKMKKLLNFIIFFVLFTSNIFAADEIEKGKTLLKSLSKKSLTKKETISFLKEYAIILEDERGDGEVTYIFDDEKYTRYKGTKIISSDAWRFSKLGALRLFNKDVKMTWKIKPNTKKTENLINIKTKFDPVGKLYEFEVKTKKEFLDQIEQIKQAEIQKKEAIEKAKIEKKKKLEQEKLAAEQKRKEEEIKIEQERLAAVQKLDEEKKKLEQERLAAEKKLDEEKKKLEQERLAAEQKLVEEKKKLEEEKLALQKEIEELKQKKANELKVLQQSKKTSAQIKKEERERKKQEKLTAQKKAKEEKERLKQEKLAAKKKAKEEKERLKQEKLAAQKKAKKEEERKKLAAQKKAKEEEERKRQELLVKEKQKKIIASTDWNKMFDFINNRMMLASQRTPSLSEIQLLSCMMYAIKPEYLSGTFLLDGMYDGGPRKDMYIKMKKSWDDSDLMDNDLLKMNVDCSSAINKFAR